MIIRTAPDDLVTLELERVCKFLDVDFSTVDNDLLEILIQNLRQFHGSYQVDELRTAVQMAMNGITEPKGRPGLNVRYLANVLNCYRIHKSATNYNQTQEHEPDIYERTGKTKEQLNKEIYDGFYEQVERYKKDPETYEPPIFYIKWFEIVGVNVYEYLDKTEAEYIAEAKEGTYEKFGQWETHAYGHKVSGLKQVMKDFMRYVCQVNPTLDVNYSAESQVITA